MACQPFLGRRNFFHLSIWTVIYWNTDKMSVLPKPKNFDTLFFVQSLILLWQVTLNNSYHRRFGENHQMKKDFSSSVQLLKRR